VIARRNSSSIRAKAALLAAITLAALVGTAFVYREKIVAGCTCNGRDAFGLVNIPVGDDPTLRPGDIVATNSGLMAYNGHIGRKQTASFTPIASYSGLSSELRRKLTGTKIEPAEATPAPPPPAAAARATRPRRGAARTSGCRPPGSAPRRHQSARPATTSSAIDSEAVSPGDSIPNSWTRRGTPCWRGPSIMKSAAASP